jgi:hypothetical protein
MFRKVRIKKLPQARTGYQVNGSLANDIASFGGADYNHYMGVPDMEISKYMTAVPREEANLEAEGGETVYGDINGDNFPEHKIIKGPRHSEGGVPLKLPEDSFIFSDTNSMKINDKNILQMFNKPMKKGKGNKGYTPAELAKQYDIDGYRKILQNPDSDNIDRKTAELMIRNYNMKLGALALAQESKKGFPQGIPVMAKPYLEANGIEEEQLLPPQLPEPQAPASPDQEQMMAYEDQGMMQEGMMQEGMMPQEMMQPGQEQMIPPMAEYGMMIGGYDMPYAEYGMAMGANPMNYMGRTKEWYQDGGELDEYQDGGEPPKGQIIKRSDYADDAAYQLALKKAYLKAQKDGQQIYVQEPNGKYTTVKAEYAAPDKYTGDLTKWNNNADVAGRYYAMEAALKDPATAKLFANATRSAIQNQEAYRTKDKIDPRTGRVIKGTIGSSYGKLNADELSDEEIVKNFMEHQERNMKLAASGNESFLYKDANGKLRSLESSGNATGDNRGFKDIMKQLKKPDGSSYTDAEINAKYQEMQRTAPDLDAAFKNIGLEMPAQAKGTAAEQKALLQQATFQGYNQLVKDFNEGKITNEDDMVRLMNFRGNLQRGYNDETGQAVTDISPIDAYYTNTTAGQISNYENLKFSEIPEKDQPCPCTDDAGKPIQRGADGKCPCPEETTKCPCGVDPVTKECLPCQPPQKKPANWWLQDTIKTAGAFGDLMGIEKYMPYSPLVDLEEPRPTFLDPTRELAQQSEQANIASQALGQFAGPQALSARASSIQGTGAKQAADTLSRFNNANVNIADQFEFKSVDVRNQEAIANQAAQSKLYDQNTIANQQYDNAKLAMSNQLRNYYTNAITNRSKTAALNELYPQYSVLPETGGMPGFEFGKKNKPETGGTKTYDQFLEYYLSKGFNNTEAIAAAEKAYKSQSSNTSDDALDVINAQYGVPQTQGKYGGYMQEGGFVYADSIYPFIL